MPRQRPNAPKAWNPPLDRAPNILLVRLSALGDVLHALPVLSALRARYPHARIDWVVEDRHAGLLEQRKDLDTVIVYPRRDVSSALGGVPNPARGFRVVADFLRQLRGEAYDVVLDLQGNLKSGVIARLARGGVRMGFDRRVAREANHLFSTRRWLPPAALRHRVERGLGLASALVGEPLPYVAPGFPIAPEAEAAAEALRARRGLERGGYVVMHPGTSGFGSFKRWPTDRFGEVARRLATAGQPVLVTHGPGEAALAAAVVASAGLPGVHAVAPEGLGTLAALIRDAAGFLGADTGPLHLAGLVDTPLLGLFGPKDPEIYGPFGAGGERLATLTQPDVACRPCTLRRCGAPLCMTTLAPGRVYERFAEVMHQAPQSG